VLYLAGEAICSYKSTAPVYLNGDRKKIFNIVWKYYVTETIKSIMNFNKIMSDYEGNVTTTSTKEYI